MTPGFWTTSDALSHARLSGSEPKLNSHTQKRAETRRVDRWGKRLSAPAWHRTICPHLPGIRLSEESSGAGDTTARTNTNSSPPSPLPALFRNQVALEGRRLSRISFPVLKQN